MGSVDKRSKRMRTSRDVIDRFFHDATFDTEQVSVGYLDRCAGGLVERPLSAFFHGDISSVGPDVLAIPQHRIHYFAYEGERVWDKTSGLDRIFGSTGAKRLLADELLERPAPEVAEAVPHEAVPLEVVPSPETTTAAAWATSASSRNAESAARPNAFFCVPVHDPAVLRTAAEVQAALAASEPRVDLRARGALTPLSSLHITLGTCRIESEHERRVAVAIAAESAQRLHELVTDPLRLSGVRGFRDRVLCCASRSPTRRRRAARSRSRSRRCATSCSRWEATPTWRSSCGGFEY